MGKVISSFRDLRVYRLGFELQQEIFVLSKKFPPEERFALTDQMRRSARSIGGGSSGCRCWTR